MKQKEKKSVEAKNLVIDVDRAIGIYNKKNPDLREMDRKHLAEILQCNKQVFTDWRGGKTPSLIFKLFTIMQATGATLEDFIVPKEAVND